MSNNGTYTAGKARWKGTIITSFFFNRLGLEVNTSSIFKDDFINVERGRERWDISVDRRSDIMAKLGKIEIKDVIDGFRFLSLSNLSHVRLIL